MATMYVGKYADGGSKNSFYKMKGRRYGFKSFPNKSLADFAHAVQRDLSEPYTLAPRVYSPVCRIRIPNYFAVSDGKGGIRREEKLVLSDWGYLTEIASPCHCRKCDRYCYENDLCDKYETINDLVSEIYDSFGINYNDTHNANLGYVKRGKNKVLVIVDVGRESMGEIGEYEEPCWAEGTGGDEYEYCSCNKCGGGYSA
jgi:hypothetical protein